MTEYVTTADALFFHRHLIDRYGGGAGIHDLSALESARHHPQAGYFNSLVDQAAALLESLVQIHPLADGNRRIVFAAIDIFLRINGYTNTADSTAIYRHLMEFIETGNFDRAHLVPRQCKVIEVR